MKNSARPYVSAEMRIAGCYAIIASAWIAFSDEVLDAFISDPHRLAVAQTWKGIFFVAFTSVLLFLMVRRSLGLVRDRDFKLSAIVRHSPSALSLKDLTGRYVLANPVTQRIHGQTAAQLLGKTDRDLFPADIAAMLADHDAQVLQRMSELTFAEVLPVNGVSRDFLSYQFPVTDEGGAPLLVGRISLDVTEYRTAERELQKKEAFVRGILNSVSAQIAVIDSAGFIVATNEAWRKTALDNSNEVGAPARLTGVNSSYLQVCDSAEVDGAAVGNGIRAVLSGKVPSFTYEYPCHSPVSEHWFSMNVTPMEQPAPGAVVVHTDITAQKLNDSRTRLAASVFEHSHEGMLITDATFKILDVNPAFSRITGYSREEVMNKNPRVLSSGRHDAAFYSRMRHSLETHDFWQDEIWNRRKNGEVYAERLTISAVRDATGALQRYTGIFSDISQIKAHATELDRMANYDSLTGVPNRRLLVDRIDCALARAQRSSKVVAICYLDLDGFRPINEQHGHQVGDRLLVMIAERLSRVLRTEDTLARLGGDEFVLLLTDLSKTEEIHVVLDRVLASFREPLQIDDQTVHITASLGVTMFPADEGDADAMLRHADQAMYRAKEAGKNRYHLFDPAHDRQVQAHRDSLQRLRIALKNREFVLFYQPKVDLVSRVVIGAEALIRWQHPERGLLAPGEFLHILDGSDLEFEVGEWVFETVLTQLSTWSALGLNLTVSANVSANHLLRPNFADRLRQMLARHPEVNPGNFELEILETAALSDMEQSVVVLTECRKLGVHFALDDFGTGYSSLTYFRNLPVEVLKIDQSFVREMLVDADDCSIVETVIRLAETFHRSVIAEGVETVAHGEMLVRLGCRLAQGYGIARPMPAEKLPSWLEGWQGQKQLAAS